jgi:hypothetical protein
MTAAIANLLSTIRKRGADAVFDKHPAPALATALKTLLLDSDLGIETFVINIRELRPDDLSVSLDHTTLESPKKVDKQEAIARYREAGEINNLWEWVATHYADIPFRQQLYVYDTLAVRSSAGQRLPRCIYEVDGYRLSLCPLAHVAYQENSHIYEH